MPLKYLANLFSNGDEKPIAHILKKELAVRLHRRQVTVGDLDASRVSSALTEVSLNSKTADDIYQLTSLASFGQRFVIPPAHREEALELIENTGDRKGYVGFGLKEMPARRGL